MSNLSKWRKNIEATEEIELPSGTAVIRSNVTILDLAAAGLIPETLLSELEEIGDARGKASAAVLPRVAEALDTLAIAAFVDPKVTKEGGEDSLAASEIPVMDKLILFQRLNRATDALRHFRVEKREPDRASQSGDGVQLPPE